MVYRPISNQTHPINRIIVFRLPLSSNGSLKTLLPILRRHRRKPAHRQR